MGAYIRYMLGGLWKSEVQQKSLPEIQHIFRQFGPGSVDLTLGEDGIAILVLNNPEKRNAMSGKMMAELIDAIERLEEWKTGKGVLIHGAGVGFCSGGDLDFIRKSESSTLGSDLSRILTGALHRLSALPIVSVAYVHGFGALGGGAEIAIAADFLVMSPCSRIGFVHGKMGLTPAWGGATRLLQTVGRKKTLELLLTARLIPTEEAREIGIAQRCGDLNFAESFLKSLCVLSPSLIGAMKSTLNGDEEAVFVSMFGGEENKKALAARIKHKE